MRTPTPRVIINGFTSIAIELRATAVRRHDRSWLLDAVVGPMLRPTAMDVASVSCAQRLRCGVRRAHPGQPLDRPVRRGALRPPSHLERTADRQPTMPRGAPDSPEPLGGGRRRIGRSTGIAPLMDTCARWPPSASVESVTIGSLPR